MQPKCDVCGMFWRKGEPACDCMSLESRIARGETITLQELPCPRCARLDDTEGLTKVIFQAIDNVQACDEYKDAA